MRTQIESILNLFKEKIKIVNTEKDIEDIRIGFLGKKG